MKQYLTVQVTRAAQCMACDDDRDAKLGVYLIHVGTMLHRGSAMIALCGACFVALKEQAHEAGGRIPKEEKR